MPQSEKTQERNKKICDGIANTAGTITNVAMASYLERMIGPIPSAVVAQYAGSKIESCVKKLFSRVLQPFVSTQNVTENNNNIHTQELLDDYMGLGVITSTEYYKASNFLKIAQKASFIYNSQKNNNKHSQSEIDIDIDWFYHFFETSGKISDEQLQYVWAKILADEITNQGKFSLQTLHTLANMRKQDIILFDRIIKHSFISEQIQYIPYYKDYLNQHNINFRDIMDIHELGIIYIDDKTMGIPIDGTNRKIDGNSDLVLVAWSLTGKEINAEFNLYPFTKVGRELASLQNHVPSNNDLLLFGKLLNLNKNNKNITFGLHKIISINEGKENFETVNLLEESPNQIL